MLGHFCVKKKINDEFTHEAKCIIEMEGGGGWS